MSDHSPSLKFAGIDIGSNAMRLYLMRVFLFDNKPMFKKESFIRLPVRLGEDAFRDQKLSLKTKNKFLHTMQAFKHIIQMYQPDDYLCYATSAMREIKNGESLIREVHRKCRLKIEIISGKKEAEILYENHFENNLDEGSFFMYVDVGGGSTECTILSNKAILDSRSFKIGTVRLLHGLVHANEWDEMKVWLRERAKLHQPLIGIGSGGNINKIRELTGKKGKNEVRLKTIEGLRDQLESYTLNERISQLRMKPDRAEVIVPACNIYASVMKWSRARTMIVPKIGLVDGMIHCLYEKNKHKLTSVD